MVREGKIGWSEGSLWIFDDRVYVDVVRFMMHDDTCRCRHLLVESEEKKKADPP